MDVGAVLIQLKPNSMPAVESWKATLQSRQQEVIETLLAEGVHVESWFYLPLEGQDYLLAYMRADDIARAQQIGRESQFPIDQVHRAFKQNWFKVFPAQLLLDFVAKPECESI